MFLFLWILFLADSRKFYPLIFADFFLFLFFADVYFISRGCFSFLADSRKFYPLIFADFFYVFFLRISFLADSRGFYFSLILFLADSSKFYARIFADVFLCFQFILLRNKYLDFLGYTAR